MFVQYADNDPNQLMTKQASTLLQSIVTRIPHIGHKIVASACESLPKKTLISRIRKSDMHKGALKPFHTI